MVCDAGRVMRRCGFWRDSGGGVKNACITLHYLADFSDVLGWFFIYKFRIGHRGAEAQRRVAEAKRSPLSRVRSLVGLAGDGGRVPKDALRCLFVKHPAILADRRGLVKFSTTPKFSRFRNKNRENTILMKKRY